MHSQQDPWIKDVDAPGGGKVRIRPLRPDDRAREVAFIESLSAQTRLRRMHAPLKILEPHLLNRLMDVDHDLRMAFVATVDRDKGEEKFVGVARYGAHSDRSTAEMAITVTDAWQRHGVGRQLLGQLMRYASARGIRSMYGHVLPDNHPMIALARGAGFRVSWDSREKLVRVERELPGNEVAGDGMESAGIQPQEAQT